MTGGNWYKPDCERCKHFILVDEPGFIISKECSLSPLEKCPFPDYDEESGSEIDYSDEEEFI